MSKIEVNTVEPQCGTTLTLGGSGDTVAIGAGASTSGMGRTGTVDWITTPKVTGDSPVTGVSGNGYFMNTTAGLITINLPAGTAGDIISLMDYAATWDTYALTITPNGTEKIGGTNASKDLTTKGQSVTFVYVDSTQGWLNTMDSTSNVRANEFVEATGGCITCSGDDKIHTFTGPGTFTVTGTAIVAAQNLVSYMVVGGGGAGGTDCGGGGGAGGFREVESPTTPYTASPIEGYPSAPNRITITATAYPITIGAGGNPVTGTGPGGAIISNPGSNSVFSTATAAGGGRGGSSAPSASIPTPILLGGAGGSGGGGSWGASGGHPSPFPGGAGNTPPTTPAQGFTGGSGLHNTVMSSQGGGGGATAVGLDGAPGTPGKAGGAGTTTEISTSPVAFAGGAGGAGCGTGGTGGGGNGATPSAAGTAGGVNTGGGGGGSKYSQASGQGGSGKVIIRYKYK